jgi:hypothetical protein
MKYLLATTLAGLSAAANAGLEPSLSADVPGLLALGAVALVAGVQLARRNRRK